MAGLFFMFIWQAGMKTKAPILRWSSLFDGPGGGGGGWGGGGLSPRHPPLHAKSDGGIWNPSNAF